MLPSVPTVSCANADDLKLLMMRVDANCTIRNSDFKKYTTTGLGGANSSSRTRIGSFRSKATTLLDRQLKKSDCSWDEKVKSSGQGVILNYEQRIKEIEGDRYNKGHSNGGKESPRSLQNMPAVVSGVHERVLGTRVPSAPTTDRRLSLHHSLLSL